MGRRHRAGIRCSAVPTRSFRPGNTAALTASKTFSANIRRKITGWTTNTAGSIPLMTRLKIHRFSSRCGTWWRISIQTSIWKHCSPNGTMPFRRRMPSPHCPCSGTSMLETSRMPRSARWSSFRMPYATRWAKNCSNGCRMIRSVRQSWRSS